MGWKPDHKRIKATYSPILSAAEKRHEARVQGKACFGCGRYGCSAHHLMLPFPEKRWRRDHRFRLPLCRDCHQGPKGVHGVGSEALWLESIGRTPDEAIDHVLCLWAESEQEERKAA